MLTLNENDKRALELIQSYARNSSNDLEDTTIKNLRRKAGLEPKEGVSQDRINKIKHFAEKGNPKPVEIQTETVEEKNAQREAYEEGRRLINEMPDRLKWMHNKWGK